MPLEVEVRPAWPYRLRTRLGGDGVARRRGSVVSRLLATADGRVVVHVWQPQSERVVFRAGPADADRPAGREALELAIERMRFAVAVDEDMSEFARTFRGDPLIGEIIHHRPWHRPRRRPWPWEALAWAVTEQLIESSRAAEIQRRVVRRWGDRLQPADDGAWIGPGPLRDVPSAEAVAGIAPAELAAFDLAPSRAIALIRCAREVARGRVDPARPEGDRRLARIPGIGPWTLQVLGFSGRGEPDSLPAGDLAYVKLVGSLAGLGRRATVEEVEEYFAPYAPFRGLAGSFALARWHGAVAAGPPLRRAA
ncbi:MAG: DNA-3-methyladenine glycosylase family protein [Vicinamibacteria bacterium]